MLQFTRAIRKSASSMLSAASQLIFAHKMALPSWFLVHRFSCEHGICTHEVTGELVNKIKFILDRPLFQCYNASDEQRRS